MQNSKVFYHFVAFIVVAIWGSTFVFTKLLLLGGLTAAQIFTLRFIIAYILMLGFCLYKGIRWVAKCWQDEVLLAILGIAGGSLYFLAENNAMNYTTTTNTSLIVSLSPLFASALISLFYKSQRLNRIQVIGSLMAAVGVVMVVMNGHFVLHLSPKGDLLAFSAALCWAVYSLLMIYANAKYDTLFITRKVFFYVGHDSLFHPLSRVRHPATHRPQRPYLESAFPGLCSLHALFPGLELGIKKVGGSSSH